MFTGIVEEIGQVRSIGSVRMGFELTVKAERVLEGTALGDSIAINGVCLTVTDLAAHAFTVGLSPETSRRTNLISLRPGSRVNLERAVSAETRMGGHFVQGHIDNVGIITAVRREREARWLTVRVQSQMMQNIVARGFIALDGISLTVGAVHHDTFTVNLIAYTQQHVTLANQPVGYRVNVELDVMSKYAAKSAQSQPDKGTITSDFLLEHGYE